MSYPHCPILLPVIGLIAIAVSSCSSNVEKTLERGVPILIMDSTYEFDQKVIVPDISAFRITDQFAIDTTVLASKPYEPYEVRLEDYDSTPSVARWHPLGVPGRIQSHLRGDVYVGVYVDSAGNVPYAYILKSKEVLLNKPALETIVRWKFVPAVLNGKKAPCWITMVLRSRPD